MTLVCDVSKAGLYLDMASAAERAMANYDSCLCQF